VGLEEQAAVLRDICEGHGATGVRLAFGQAERDRLWFARKSAAGAIARLAPAYYLQDGTVPRSRLGELMARVEEVGKAYGLSICNVFHAGDGNLHPLILFDPEDAGQASKVIAASRAILEKCIEAGGNITGEHGVGIEKILEMGMQFTPGEIQVMREVKQVFDPEDRCNPGKILPALPLDPAEWAARGAEPPAGDPPASSLIQADAWFEPESTDQVAALMRRRQADRAPIDAVGGGTKLHLARRTSDAVLSLRRMDRVVEYAPQDLYVRVQAGMTLGGLQQLAARDGLWWPVPHPWSDATVGGIVASNWNGPARWRLGAIRDLVLGGVVVLADGRNLRVGGKVVKNVAGYDLTKLHVGALGTLGVLCELNLKLAAVPQAHRSIAASATTPRDGIASALHAFQESLVASSILVFGGDRSGLPLPADGGATVVATAAGHPADVGEEIRILGGVLGAPQALDAPGETIWSQWQRRAASRDGVLLRIGVPNGRLPEVVSHRALEGADFVADATAGVVWASCPAGLDPGSFAELRQSAIAAAGYVTVLGAPPAVLQRIDAWGHRSDLAPWMERLRRRWDPAGILNPGRFQFTS
jgi:D-lactate dehydrogenase (cytochrome)